MRAQTLFRYVAGATPVIISAAVGVSALAAAPPAPCDGAPQISDASEDGHHPATDVLAAWFSEASGHLQAVIQVRAGLVGRRARRRRRQRLRVRVRVHRRRPDAVRARQRAGRTTRPTPVTYDYGTYTRRAGSPAPGRPPASRRGAPRRDGDDRRAGGPGRDRRHDAGQPVRRSPTTGSTAACPTGSTTRPAATEPSEAAFGADYVVGSCGAAAARRRPRPGRRRTAADRDRRCSCSAPRG